MPVSNHTKLIAHTKSGHIARAFPATDLCWDATHMIIVPGDNYIDTANLGTGKTTKTFIHEANVWTAAGLIDAAPSDPAHAGVGGGIISGTYRKEAGPITYSMDVKFESNGVVRTDDFTTQNHKNTIGMVDGSEVTDLVEGSAEWLKKKCTIEKIEGHCKHGRQLGAPPNAKSSEPFFLDVTGYDEVVTLISTRKDLIAKAPADCAKHTAWAATRSGAGSAAKLEFVGDTFEITGSVLADPWTGTELAGPKSPKTGDEKRYAQDKKDTQKALNEYGGGGFMGLPAQSGKGNFQSQTAPTGPGVVQSIANQRTAEYNRELNSTVNKRAVVAAIKDLEKAIAFWLIEREPPVVNVTALACGGAKHVMLRVFPKDPIVFDLFSEALNAKFKLIRDISKVVEYITGKFGVSFSLKFLEGPNVTLGVAYKELTEDKNGFVKTQVRKAWNLTFTFSAFFEVAAKFTLPLLPLLAAVASPVVAQAAKWLLDKAGVEINAFAEIKLAINPSIAAIRDQYDDGSVTGPTVKLDITFSIGLEAKVGSWGAAEVRAYLQGTIALEAWKFAPAPAMVQSDLTGYIQLGLKGFIKVTFWGVEVAAKSFDWKPDQLRFPAKEGGGGSWKITTFHISVR